VAFRTGELLVHVALSFIFGRGDARRYCGAVSASASRRAGPTHPDRPEASIVWSGFGEFDTHSLRYVRQRRKLSRRWRILLAISVQTFASGARPSVRSTRLAFYSPGAVASFSFAGPLETLPLRSTLSLDIDLIAAVSCRSDAEEKDVRHGRSPAEAERRPPEAAALRG
jgi:hypothetical protein